MVAPKLPLSHSERAKAAVAGEDTWPPGSAVGLLTDPFATSPYIVVFVDTREGAGEEFYLSYVLAHGTGGDLKYIKNVDPALVVPYLPAAARCERADARPGQCDHLGFGEDALAPGSPAERAA